MKYETTNQLLEAILGGALGAIPIRRFWVNTGIYCKVLLNLLFL